MTDKRKKELADALADIFIRMDDLKVEAAAIIDAEKEAGINVKALRKVAKELAMPAEKLAQRVDDEEQLDMFRSDVGLKARKGLTFAEAAE